MSPTERAVDDHRRLKARTARHRTSPGPGAYDIPHDPKRVGSTQRDLIGSSAFRSQTARTERTVVGSLTKEQGDPAAYEPIFLTLARQASASWSKVASAGNASFGVSTRRALDLRANANQVWGEGEKTPGVGTYSFATNEKGRQWDTSTIGNTRETWGASKTKRSDVLLLPSAPNPGPGEYNVNDAATIEHLPGANPASNMVSSVSRDARFTSDTLLYEGTMTTQANVGPGSYDSHLGGTIAFEGSHSVKSEAYRRAGPDAGSDSLGFGTREAQHILPAESLGAIKSATPGPGAYTIDGLTHHGPEHKHNGFQSAFIPTDIKTEMDYFQQSDPGQYNPKHRDIQVQALDTCNVPARDGKSSFGAATARVLRLDVQTGMNGVDEVTPGPAAYSKPSLSARLFNRFGQAMKTASFASKSQRSDVLLLPSAPNPGVGEYDVNVAATIEHLPGANPASNMVSSVSRDARFTSDTLLYEGTMTTSAKVGPGSYDSHIEGTISQKTQSLDERWQRAGFGSSSSSQHVLPHEVLLKSEFRYAVGPGSYDSDLYNQVQNVESHNVHVREGRAEFGSHAPARADPFNWDTGGDPGQYADYALRNDGVAATARRSQRRPDGKDGSQSARELRWDVQNGMDGVAEVTPGPAAYTFHTNEKGRQWDTSTIGNTRETWGASKTKRSDVLLLPSAPNPGPGEYNVNDAATIEHLPGANPASNMVSSVSRDARFTSDTLLYEGTMTTQANVGPGAYTPQQNFDGSRPSIEAQADHNADMGWSANFFSRHLRQLGENVKEWLSMFGLN